MEKGSFSFAEIIEAADASPSRRPVYVVSIILILILVLTFRAKHFFADLSPRASSDFDAFYTAAKLTLSGQINEAYSFVLFQQHLKDLLGKSGGLAWAYPPPFDVMVAPLGLLSLPVAFSLFFATTLPAFLWTLYRLDRQSTDRRLGAILMMAAPCISVVFIIGQNGLITGTLIGLTCLGLASSRRWPNMLAGLPLGLMVIKPHLAIGVGFYLLVSRNWAGLGVAICTVIASAVIATVLLGLDVWTAFLGGLQEASTQLRLGQFPLFRMVSPFATLRTYGVSIGVAAGVQMLSAIVAVALIATAHFQLPRREAIGMSAAASMLISPYAYDYDLTVMVVGLALLLPAIISHGRAWERSVLYLLFLQMAVSGTILKAINVWDQSGASVASSDPLTINALALVGLLALTCRILLRLRANRPSDGAVVQ
jgi:hypothetical protein